MSNHQPPTALITGAAKRIGASITRTLHQLGYNVVVHYHASAPDAKALCIELNQLRPFSAFPLQADLNDTQRLPNLISQTLTEFHQLDLLVNNASRFYPTPMATATEQAWDNLFNTNVKYAFFLSQQAAPYLAQTQGQIINITDIHADQPLKSYPIYCAAKAALAMLTRALAKDLAPIRVNSIAPGAILWPDGEAEISQQKKQDILNRIPLKRHGSPHDIAATIGWLAQHGHYITGQTIHVAGGRQHAR